VAGSAVLGSTHARVALFITTALTAALAFALVATGAARAGTPAPYPPTAPTGIVTTPPPAPSPTRSAGSPRAGTPGAGNTPTRATRSAGSGSWLTGVPRLPGSSATRTRASGVATPSSGPAPVSSPAPSGPPPEAEPRGPSQGLDALVLTLGWVLVLVIGGFALVLLGTYRRRD